jgi:hypothetical protein
MKGRGGWGKGKEREKRLKGGRGVPLSASTLCMAWSKEVEPCGLHAM